MKKVVVACIGNEEVAQHFGHCENFVFFDTEDNKIVGKEVVPNPGHKPGFLPNFLADHGAKVILSGGMGGGAVDIFNERGVQVVTGAAGDATAAVAAFLEGTLVSNGEVCQHHDHEHEDGHECRH